MPCKTRQAALRGERSKPHFYIHPVFGPTVIGGAPVPSVGLLRAFGLMRSWGASR